jgi:hypothetical protein
LELARYKTIVFSNVFHLTSQQKLFIKSKVAKDGKHIVWNYMPGYTNGHENSIKFIKEVTGFDVALTTDTSILSIRSTGDEYPLTKSERSSGHIHPFLQITDKKAEALGVREATKEVVVAKKAFSDHTVWFSTYLFNKPEIFRHIFKSSGAHIYGEGNDVFHDDGRLLMIHTKTGGKKIIRLRNGNELPLELKPETTVYVDSNTGAILLQ